MGNSNLVPFREVLVEPVRNGVYKTKEFHGRGEKIVNMGELFANTRLFDVQMKRVELSDKEKQKGLLQEGDLLFARRSLTAAGAGKCSIVTKIVEPTTFESSIIRARPNTNKAIPEYLYYFFSSPLGRDAIDGILRQVAVSGITGNDLMRLLVPCPPIHEQKQIAKTLGSIDDRIELLRETNRTLEDMARLLFRAWFVEFEPVRAKMAGLPPKSCDAATAELFPSRLVDSELGEIPEGWEVKKIEEVSIKVGMGPFGSNIKVSTFVDYGIPIISGQHLQNTLMEDTAFNFITEEHAQRLSSSMVSSGDVVFTHAGNIGQVALIPKNTRYTRYVLSQRQFYLRCNLEKLFPTYITYFFKTANGQHLLLANASQVGVPSIARPVSYLKSLGLLVPDIEIQKRFDEFVSSIHQKFTENLKLINSLSKTRDELLPRLMSGSLKLPESLME